MKLRGQGPRVRRREHKDPNTSNLLRLFWVGNSYRLRVPAGQLAIRHPRGKPRRTKVRKGLWIQAGRRSIHTTDHTRVHHADTPRPRTCERTSPDPRSLPRTRVGAPAHTHNPVCCSLTVPCTNHAHPERANKGTGSGGRRGSPEDTFSRRGHVSQHQQGKKELHGA